MNAEQAHNEMRLACLAYRNEILKKPLVPEDYRRALALLHAAAVQYADFVTESLPRNEP